MGIVQLDKLEEIIERKLNILKLYRELLHTVKQVTFFEPPSHAEWVPFRIPLFCERAHELMEFLTGKEIETRTFFYPLHSQPAFKYLQDKSTSCDDHFPQAVSAYNNGVCFPIFPALSEEQVRYVCSRIVEFYG
jgi:perosamine synthetase